MSNINNQIINCIKEAVRTKECEIEVIGTPLRGEGGLGDVNFVKVTLNEPNQNKTVLDLVAKVSKNVPGMEEFIPLIFKTEIMFYNQIIPILTDFQQEKNVKEPFNAFPKFYKTLVGESTDVILLENLKKRGYESHPRHIPLDIHHIKLVLKNYAKFHAISFALSDQRKDIFDKIDKLYDPAKFVEKINDFKEMYHKTSTKVIHDLNEAGRQDLADKYKLLQESGIMMLIVESLGNIPKEKVVTHGDCHNSNVLFKYKNSNQETPSEVVFLDFQMSNLLSPMQDVGYFLYMVASKEEFSHFNELMEFYHEELSSFLFELGSDVNKLFPKSTMWEHWKKYTFFGFCQASGFIELFCSDVFPTTDNLVGNVDEFFSKTVVKDRSAYLDRLVAIVEHYFNFN